MKYIDPAELKPHSLRTKLQTYADDDPRYIALVDDIKDRGIQLPLLITSDARIVDGLSKWRAAKRLQLKTVPVITIPDEEVALTIVQTLLQRRHFTKGALAYLTFPLVADAADEVKKRGSKYFTWINALSTNEVLTALVERTGIGLRVYLQAKELHKIFAEREDLKAKFEPEIIEGEIGLGAAVAGANYLIKGNKTGGAPKEVTKQLDLFTDGFKTMQTRYKYWDNFDLPQKETAVRVIRNTVSAMPPTLRTEWKRAINAAERDEAAAKQ